MDDKRTCTGRRAQCSVRNKEKKMNMKTEMALPIRPLARGTVCRTAMQCTDPETGKVGDWLFTGDDWRIKGTRCTPVFEDFYALCRWNIDGGRRFEVVGGHPGVYIWQGSMSEHGQAVENLMLSKYPNLF